MSGAVSSAAAQISSDAPPRRISDVTRTPAASAALTASATTLAAPSRCASSELRRVLDRHVAVVVHRDPPDGEDPQRRVQRSRELDRHVRGLLRGRRAVGREQDGLHLVLLASSIDRASCARAAGASVRDLTRFSSSVQRDERSVVLRLGRTVYRIVERHGASLVVVHCFAPLELVRERLAGRLRGVDPLDRSDATWAIHQRLGRVQPIRLPHLLVNTSLDLRQAVRADRQVRAAQRTGDQPSPRFS